MPIAMQAEEHECLRKGFQPNKKARSIQQKARLPNDRTQGKEMTPDRCVLDQGSFLFRLGFDHWVTSLSAGSTGLFLFGWNPFRSIHVLQRSIAIGIYVKRKNGKAQPAGVITISGITFFRTISLPFFGRFYKTGFRPNNFRNNGVKQRNHLFLILKC